MKWILLALVIAVPSQRAHACGYRTWGDNHIDAILLTIADGGLFGSLDLVMAGYESVRKDPTPGWSMAEAIIGGLQVAAGALGFVLTASGANGTLGYPDYAVDDGGSLRTETLIGNGVIAVVGAALLLRGLTATPSSSPRAAWHVIPTGRGLCATGTF